MKERVAIIDCGTNTFNLLIVEIEENKQFKKIFNTRLPVKLGEGAINHGFIAQVPFNRGLSAIEAFESEIKNRQVDTTIAFATSAIRDAKNGQDFVALVKEKHNINIQIIDGDKEAELIYLGVKSAIQPQSQFSLIMDIGGGSTEFILADHEKIIWQHSFQLGAARLLDRFKPSDPITEAEMEAIYAFLKLKLEPLLLVGINYKCKELIGSSGAFDSLVEIIHSELGGEVLTENKTEYCIDLSKYRIIADRIQSSDIEERRRIKGLVAMRVDMIVISCLMIDFILKEMDLKNMRVSTYSLKEGALMEYLKKK